MKNETSQPFNPNEPRKTDDTKLVAEVLGTKEAAEMVELVGQVEPPETESVSLTAGLDLSVAEGGAVAGAEKIKKEKRYLEYTEWAETFGKDEDWIDDNFVFNPDGSVETKGNLNLEFWDVEKFPKGFKKINGDCNLNGCNFLNLIGFPEEITGDLILSSNYLRTTYGINKIKIRGVIDLHANPLNELVGLPDVMESLILASTDIKSLDPLIGKTINRTLSITNLKLDYIPPGINIKGEIFIERKYKGLISQARARGYQVREI